MNWLKDFWDAGPFAGGKSADGYDKEVDEVAKATGTSYEKAAYAQDVATKDMAKEGFFKPGAPSKDSDHKA